jgi:hypothetical protein
MHSSPDIFRVIRSGRMRWTRYIESMRKIRNTHKILNGKPEAKT